MTRTLIAGVLLATGLLTAPALADEPACDGGVTAPVKPVLHALEGPLAGTPGEEVVHTAECALP